MLNTLNTDLHPRYQKDSYRYALNANIELDGNLMLLSTEEGNLPCGDFPQGISILGHCLTDTDNIILFLSNNSIVLYNPNTCDVKTIYSNPLLNFHTHIQAVYKIHNSCDGYVYFAEEGNPLRYLNITKPQTDINDLKYSPNITIPNLSVASIDSTGALKVGAYEFAIRYLDQDYTPTNFLAITNPVNISDYPNTNDVTSKSITLNVDNLVYPNFQLAVIEYTSGNQSVTAVKLLPYNTKTYTGDNALEDILLSEVITDYKIVREVFTLKNTQNRLFIANLKNNEYDYAAVQEYISNNEIPVRWVTKKIPKNQNLLYKSFRRNEVYSFGLMGYFNETDTTPVFHLPGRKKNTILPDVGNKQSEWPIHPRPKVTALWDTELVTSDIPNCIDSTCKQLLFHEANFSKKLSNNVEINFTASIPFGYSTKIIVTYDNDSKSYSTNSTIIKGKISFKYKNSQNYTIQYIIENPTCTYSYVINHDFGYTTEIPHYLLPEDNILAKQPRFKVFNTALKNESSYKDFHEHGIFAYYENCTKYPNIECNSKRIYPDGNIRHFKFPDATLVPIDDDDYVYPLGIEYDLDSFKQAIKKQQPELYNNVQKWVLVVADKEATVLDSGIIQPTVRHYKSDGTDLDKSYYYRILEFPEYFNMTYPFFSTDHYKNITHPNTTSSLLETDNRAGSKKVFNFFSPKTLFQDKIEDGYLNVHRYWNPKDVENTNFGTVKTPKSGFFGYKEVVDKYCSTKLVGGKVPIDYSVNIKQAILVSPVKHITDSDAGEFLGIKTLLNNNTYHLNMLYSNNVGVISIDDTNHAAGPNKLEPVYFYASINSNKEVYTSLSTLSYHYLGDGNFIGDTYINRFDFTLKAAGFAWATKAAKILGFLDINAELGDWTGLLESSPFFYNKNLIQCYVESDINTQLRYKTTKEYEDFFRTQGVQQFLDADNVKLDETTYEYFPDYNKTSNDFSQWHNNKIYIAYNEECESCNEERNRIMYSEAAYQENKIDNWRLIKVNNYQDLQDTNSIYKLFLDKDELHALTEKHLWMVPTRQGTLQADATNITIGLSELFSIPARRISSVDYTYGGTKYAASVLSTEFGTFYISDNKLLHLSEGLKEVNNGLRNFLKDNLRSFKEEQLKELGIDYYDPFTYQLAYDPRHQRILLFKKDNFFINHSKHTEFKDGNWYYYDKLIPTNMVNFFEDKSFILSYSLLTNSFVSFHSYLNSYTFNDHKTFYTFKDKLYKHNQNNYLNFYNDHYPFIVDLVLNPLEGNTKTWDSVYFLQDGINTFDKYVAYTEDQSTGLVQFSPYKDIFKKFNIRKIDKRYHLHLDRDVSTNPFFSTRWLDIAADYPIDKVPVNYVVKNNVELPRLRQQYLQLRLYYNNTTKLSLDVIGTINSNSIR